MEKPYHIQVGFLLEKWAVPPSVSVHDSDLYWKCISLVLVELVLHMCKRLCGPSRKRNREQGKDSWGMSSQAKLCLLNPRGNLALSTPSFSCEQLVQQEFEVPKMDESWTLYSGFLGGGFSLTWNVWWIAVLETLVPSQMLNTCTIQTGLKHSTHVAHLTTALLSKDLIFGGWNSESCTP